MIRRNPHQDAVIDNGSTDAVSSPYAARTKPPTSRKVSPTPAQTGQAKVVIGRGTTWLTRVVFLRCLGVMYGIAFAVALFQNVALLGEQGILPATIFLHRTSSVMPANVNPLLEVPTLFWIFPPTDTALTMVAGIGLALSMFLIFAGVANLIIMLMLWILYQSIVHIGQGWYSFGWESQLLEMGFIALPLVPWFSIRQYPIGVPTPVLVPWAYRWLMMRIMLGAGLIKYRGDECWRDLTCMYYHHETQPIPSPLSWYWHFSPLWWHRFEAVMTFVVELGLVWLMLGGRRARWWSGVSMALFQGAIAASGNLSFLNWLTAVPCVWCFDDGHLKFIFSRKAQSKASQAATITSCSNTQPTDHMSDDGEDKIYTNEHPHEQLHSHNMNKRGRIHRIHMTIVKWGHRIVCAVYVYIIVSKSIPVVNNLISPKQAMNTSYDPLRLVNTYGAFGSVTRQRNEVILKGTRDNIREKAPQDVIWKEYEFKCKPGNVDRRPCFLSPYHLRLDWMLWFAAMQSYQTSPWLVRLSVMLMDANSSKQRQLAQSLIGIDPFEGDGGPPLYIKADLYHYSYTRSVEQAETEKRKKGQIKSDIGVWWTRTFLYEYMPPIDRENDSAKMFLQAHGLPF